MQKLQDFWRQNVDTRTVVSTVVGTAAFGIVVFALGKSGVGPLKQLAKVASGK